MKATLQTLSLLILLVSATLSGCGGEQDDYLTGTWQFQGGARTVYFTFTDSGTVTLEAERGGKLLGQSELPASISKVDGLYRVRLAPDESTKGMYFVMSPQGEGVANAALRQGKSPSLEQWPASVSAAPEDWTKRKLIKQ